jgi:hypothetical protein
MSNHKINIADSMSQAAATLAVPLARLREAKRQGCAAFRPGGRVHLDELRTWLAEHPAPVARKRKPTSLDTKAGAGPALQRLERQELEAARSLRDAEVAGDSSALAAARDWWLKVSEQLRKADLAVEENRREAGELVPRSDLESLAQGFGYWCRISVQGTLVELANRHNTIAAMAPNEFAALLHKLSDEIRFFVASALRIHEFSGKNFPTWLVNSVSKGWANDFQLSEDDWKARAGSLEALMQFSASEITEALKQRYSSQAGTALERPPVQNSSWPSAA